MYMDVYKLSINTRYAISLGVLCTYLYSIVLCTEVELLVYRFLMLKIMFCFYIFASFSFPNFFPFFFL